MANFIAKVVRWIGLVVGVYWKMVSGAEKVIVLSGMSFDDD